MPGLEPAISLALSVHAHKGVYTVLLGSGISRGAGIPTSWDITTDLLKRAGTAHSLAPGTDLQDWYRSKFGKAPEYSDLLELIAPKPAERLSLLRGYFEPTEEEREEGLKVPTPAHRAMAKLIAQKYIKVVVTTNFDRLLERSLEERGVSPRVLASPDDIAGMMPLPHTDCLIVKLNGDYLDSRFKNTVSELSTYAPETEALLDRIFSEYGLIVCGWSGYWDAGLRAAITRNTRHRFTSYWLARSDPSDQASRLIAHRQAVLVKIESADQALQELVAKIEAIEGGIVADPMSPRIAVTMAKKYLSEDRYRIQLHDLVSGELATVQGQLSLDQFPLGHPEPSEKTFVERVRRFEAICSKLVPIVATGVYWGTPEGDELWRRCVRALAVNTFSSGTSYDVWSYLHYYPVTLVTYAAGLAALLRGRLDLIRKLVAETKAETSFREPEPIATVVGSERALRMAQHLHDRPGQPPRKTPGSDYLYAYLRQVLADVFGRDIPWEEHFDNWEILLCLLSMEIDENSYWAGRFAWRGSHIHGVNPLLTNLEQTVRKQRDSHPYLVAGMFEGKPDKLLQRIDGLKNVTKRMRF